MNEFVSTFKPYLKFNEEILKMREEPIHFYIVKCFKILESSYVKMMKWELITDESKFDCDKINVKHIKSNKNKKYTKRLSTDKSRYNLLRMTFRLRSDDEVMNEKLEVVDLLIFKTGKDHCFLKDGKSYYPLFQMVDRSIYNTHDNITLKSLLMPIVLNQSNKYITTICKESLYVPVYRLLLFKKKTNPLLYFVAAMGIKNVIRFTQMSDIIRIHDNDKYNPDKEYAFETKSGFSVYCKKYFFDNDFFTRGIVEMLIDLLRLPSSRYELKNEKFWVIELGKEFINKQNHSDPVKLFIKGKELTFSFQRLVDEITKDNLDLDYKNKGSVYNIIMWMLRNYNELKMRDNMSLDNKRLRSSEYQAAYMIKELNNRMTSFTQTRAQGKGITMTDVEKLVRCRLKELVSACSSSKSPLLRLDNITNSADFFNLFKYTTKGPQAITNSDSVKDVLRGLHPSYIGKVDLTAISSSDPGLSRALTFNCPIKNKRFSSEREPASWDDNFARLYSNYFNGTRMPIISFDYYFDKINIEPYPRYKHCVQKHLDADPYFRNGIVDISPDGIAKPIVKVGLKKKRIFKAKIKR